MGITPLELVDCGVDWITVSGKSHDSGKLLALHAEKYIFDERVRGCAVEEWSMYGYEGLKAGQIACGSRADSVLVRLSGPMAQEHWREFYENASNCSRIDLQVTQRYKEDGRTIATSAYRGCLNHRRKHSGGPTLSIWKTAGGGSTLYFGKRSSEKFGRCYDKFEESKLDHYRNCTRWEIEFKGDQANSVAKTICDRSISGEALNGNSGELTLIKDIVVSYFNSHGARPGIAAAEPYLLRSACAKGDLYEKLEWLRHQVAPTVACLISHGLIDEALESLFPAGIYSELQTAIDASANTSGPTENQLISDMDH